VRCSVIRHHCGVKMCMLPDVVEEGGAVRFYYSTSILADRQVAYPPPSKVGYISDGVLRMGGESHLVVYVQPSMILYRGWKSAKFRLNLTPVAFWVAFVSKRSNVSEVKSKTVRGAPMISPVLPNLVLVGPLNYENGGLEPWKRGGKICWIIITQSCINRPILISRCIMGPRRSKLNRK